MNSKLFHDEETNVVYLSPWLKDKKEGHPEFYQRLKDVLNGMGIESKELKYFNDLVATEVYNDVLFVSEKNENVWWYDGERIVFRTPNYTKILNAMRTEPTLTLADMREITGVSIAAIQKLLDQLIQKKYVERGEKDGSWRVFVMQ